jgi:hypothetical protein
MTPLPAPAEFGVARKRYFRKQAHGH